MPGFTREIYQYAQDGPNVGKRRYAGYAKFDADGKYLGSRGGYNADGKPNKYGDNSAKANNQKSGASLLQNTVKVAGAKAANRNPEERLRLRR